MQLKLLYVKDSDSSSSPRLTARAILKISISVFGGTYVNPTDQSVILAYLARKMLLLQAHIYDFTTEMIQANHKAARSE